MEIRVLDCHGSQFPGCGFTGFLIDGRTLLDAGAATSVMTLEEQSQMDHVLISHAPLDHIREPVSRADNLCCIRRNHPLTVTSTPQVIETLKRHIFNGAIWSDFSILPSAEKPLLRFEPLRTGEKMRVGHFRRGHRADRGDLACCREGGRMSGRSSLRRHAGRDRGHGRADRPPDPCRSGL